MKRTNTARCGGAALPRQTFTVTNTGGTNVRSRSPSRRSGAPSPLPRRCPEGTTIKPGEDAHRERRLHPCRPGLRRRHLADQRRRRAGAAQGAAQRQRNRVLTLACSREGPEGACRPRLDQITGRRCPSRQSSRPRSQALGGSTAIVITYAATTAGIPISRSRARRPAFAAVSVRGRDRALSARRLSCTRFVNVATFTHRDHVGTNRVRLAGHLHRKLDPGDATGCGRS